MAFRCEPESIHEDVILAPIWEPEIFLPFVDSVTLVAEFNYRKIWEVSAGGKKISYVRSGAGAPALAHSVFGLSCTPCKNIIFIGAVGGLAENMGIGDVLIPEYSVCGDGACRYITAGGIRENDCFGERYYPDEETFARIKASAESVSRAAGARWHIGKTFSVDNIFAEFAHLEEILQLGCDSIEMETAVLFKAARAACLKAAAVFNISDNSFTRKSVYAGRTRADDDYRDYVRNNVVTKIVLDAILGRGEN
jgi:purine-nucleoside phosphorylase